MIMVLMAVLSWLPAASQSPDLEAILSKADLLLEEAKKGYEDARSRGSVGGFVEAGFKLEESKIKYIVIQEIGSPAQQKTASDRLRGVQQLTKLINDGRVALARAASGGSVPAPKPEPSSTPDAPPPPPPESASRPAVDVTRRLPPPDTAGQREAEKLLKDVFKEAYARKDPAGKQALARLLIEQAAKSGDDLVSVFVLYREASDAAVQGGDIATALLALDETARLFDVDGSALRSAAVTGAAKNARFPQEFSALAEAQLRLIDEFMAMDQYDAAEKAAVSAIQQAKRVSNPALTSRTAQRQKEVAEARSKFLSLKKVLANLAESPDHPGANLEMGQFLCFVKGSWDLGIRFLAKGSDPGLKILAEKEISLPLQAWERAAVADGWWDLGQKEVSPLRKTQVTAHARMLYEALLPEATGLLRVKIEKRLSESERPTVPGAPGAPIDLLALVDPKVDVVQGEWIRTAKGLFCPQPQNRSYFQIPYLPPTEYDLTLVAERHEGNNALIVGMAHKSSQFMVVLDGWYSTVSGLSMLDGKWALDNETAYRNPVFRGNSPATIVCAVRKDAVRVTVDGRKIVDWKGSLDRLTNNDMQATPNSLAMFLGCADTKYLITKLTLVPVSGEGKKLR